MLLLAVTSARARRGAAPWESYRARGRVGVCDDGAARATDRVRVLLSRSLRRGSGALQLIKDLRFALVRVTKSYNDSLRTFSQKLTDLGIPHEEIGSMGFVPIPTSASIGPAGLVVA